MEEFIIELLKGAKPLDELKNTINTQLKQLSKDELSLLSPLINEINSIQPSLKTDELLKKAEEIKEKIKKVENADINNNNIK